MAGDATHLEGGCLCGRLRYRLKRVKSAYWCHCTMCRRASGSAALPWLSVAREDVTFVSGTPAVFESSPGVARRFCRTCGSPIMFDMARESDVDMTIGTLDDPGRATPTHHIWVSSALHMVDDMGAGLPRYEGEQPSDL